MELVYLPTFRFDFFEAHAGKYIYQSHGSVMRNKICMICMSVSMSKLKTSGHVLHSLEHPGASGMDDCLALLGILGMEWMIAIRIAILFSEI